MIRRLILLCFLLLGCSAERPADYAFTGEYMLLPVEFRAMGTSIRPNATWCAPVQALEICVYTEGERIRIGYTNGSSSDTFHLLWSQARYVDESGNAHSIEVFPPDLMITETIEPGAHRWNSFVPSGKRYYKVNRVTPSFFS